MTSMELQVKRDAALKGLVEYRDALQEYLQRDGLCNAERIDCVEYETATRFALRMLCIE